MSVFKKVYELTYRHNLYCVYKTITFLNVTIYKKELDSFVAINCAIKFLKSIK